MTNFFPIFDLALGLYLVWFGVINSTKNALSAFLYNFIPIVGGLVLLAQGAKELGII